MFRRRSAKDGSPGGEPPETELEVEEPFDIHDLLRNGGMAFRQDSRGRVMEDKVRTRKTVAAALIRFFLDSLHNERKYSQASLFAAKYHATAMLCGDQDAADRDPITNRKLAAAFGINEWQVSRLLSAAEQRFAAVYRAIAAQEE